MSFGLMISGSFLRASSPEVSKDKVQVSGSETHKSYVVQSEVSERLTSGDFDRQFVGVIVGKPVGKCLRFSVRKLVERENTIFDGWISLVRIPLVAVKSIRSDGCWKSKGMESKRRESGVQFGNIVYSR